MSPRRHLLAAALVLFTTLASVVIVLVALDQALGERLRSDGSCCDVGFIDYGVLQLTWLLFPVLGVAAWFSVRVALAGVLGMAIPQWLALLGGVVVLVGGLLGRPRRRHDQ